MIKLRNNSLKSYGLCPSHHFSAPGLTWDAMLIMTKIKLEFITDPDMYIFLVQEVKFLIFLVDTVEPTINI